MIETRTRMDAPVLALVGCGAIAESFHLPALAEFPEVLGSLLLVDPDLDRARELTERYPVAGVASHHREVVDRVDAAIVAAPQQFHHAIVMDCLQAGIHVLCEKPLAETASQADEMLAEARRSGARIAVNNTRRLYPASRRIRELVEGGRLGRLRRIEFVEGEPFEWPAASDSYFGEKGAGKGVLLDKGAHVLDLVCWWLGGEPDLVSYRDDARGGTAAHCRVDVERDGCVGTVVLSWLSKLDNEFQIVGTEGAVRGTVYGWDSVTIQSEGGREREVRASGKRHVKADFARKMIDNFVDVARGRAEPLVPGSAVAESLRLIDRCHANRQRFDMPWFESRGRVPGDVGVLGVG